MAKNALKLSTMVEIYWSQMAKNALKLSTMIGENFEIYFSQMDRNAIVANLLELKCVTF